MNGFNDVAVKARVDKLRAVRMKWTDIAADLRVCPLELRRWRKRTKYKDILVKLSDPAEIDSVVKLCAENHPERGERILRGVELMDTVVRLPFYIVLTTIKP